MNSKTTPAIMKMVVKVMINQWPVVSDQWPSKALRLILSADNWPLITGHWSLLFVPRSHNRLDVPANVKVSLNLNAQRITGPDEVFENHIDDVFMKDLHLSKRIDVEFQTLKFNAPLIRNILQANGGEVGKI